MPIPDTGNPELDDALSLLDECGGKMAKENLPLADELISMGYAEEGDLDQFGRRTVRQTEKKSDSSFLQGIIEKLKGSQWGTTDWPAPSKHGGPCNEIALSSTWEECSLFPGESIFEGWTYEDANFSTTSLTLEQIDQAMEGLRDSYQSFYQDALEKWAKDYDSFFGTEEGSDEVTLTDSVSGEHDWKRTWRKHAKGIPRVNTGRFSQPFQFNSAHLPAQWFKPFTGYEDKVIKAKLNKASIDKARGDAYESDLISALWLNSPKVPSTINDATFNEVFRKTYAKPEQDTSKKAGDKPKMEDPRAKAKAEKCILLARRSLGLGDTEIPEGKIEEVEDLAMEMMDWGDATLEVALANPQGLVTEDYGRVTYTGPVIGEISLGVDWDSMNFGHDSTKFDREYLSKSLSIGNRVGKTVMAWDAFISYLNEVRERDPYAQIVFLHSAKTAEAVADELGVAFHQISWRHDLKTVGAPSSVWSIYDPNVYYCDATRAATIVVEGDALGNLTITKDRCGHSGTQVLPKDSNVEVRLGVDWGNGGDEGFATLITTEGVHHSFKFPDGTPVSSMDGSVEGKLRGEFEYLATFDDLQDTPNPAKIVFVTGTSDGPKSEMILVGDKVYSKSQPIPWVELEGSEDLKYQEQMDGRYLITEGYLAGYQIAFGDDTEEEEEPMWKPLNL